MDIHHRAVMAKAKKLDGKKLLYEKQNPKRNWELNDGD